MNVFPLFVAKCCGVPVRISESLSMAHDKEPKTYLKLVLRVFSRCFATHFMACGEDCGRWQFGDKAFEHGNVDVFKTAIDSRINAYSPSVRVETRSELGIGENDLTVGFIGRFAPQKNPIFIMQIMKEILRLRPSAKMILIGDGGLRDAMFSILDPDVCGSVIYLGRTENIVKFYQAIDVFLLPSLYEGLPVVGLEAQCAGCTVLFSEEITREASFCENAFFYPLSEGAAKWAEKVIELYDERKPRRSMVEECVRAAFDAREETKRLEEYYLEALGSERRKRLF